MLSLNLFIHVLHVPTKHQSMLTSLPYQLSSPIHSCEFAEKQVLKGLVHDNAHARRLSLQNKFVGSTLNSKSPLPVQSLKILRFIRTSVALAGLVILR